MPKRDSHLFLIRPDAGAVADLAQPLALAAARGARIGDARLHATLVWFGYDRGSPGLAAAAASAAGRLRAAPFRMVVDRLVGTPSRLLVQPSEPVPALAAVQARLVALLAAEGLAPARDWRFGPHVTLGYGDFADVAGPILPVAWTVDALLLVRSEIGHARHVALGRWPLSG